MPARRAQEQLYVLIYVFEGGVGNYFFRMTDTPPLYYTLELSWRNRKHYSRTNLLQIVPSARITTVGFIMLPHK
jgi:hypothetical protein